MDRDRSRTLAERAFWTFLGPLSIGWFVLFVVANVRRGPVDYNFPGPQAFGIDFSVNIWHATGQILHGRSIYPAHVRAPVPSTVSVNPPLLAVLTTPLRLVPYPVALGVFDALGFGAFALSLWLAGIRDWRLFCIACGSAPVASDVICGQVTAFLALGYALAWRWRGRPYVVGLLVGLLIALKLFALPLLIWLVLTRRGRSAVVAVASGVALTLLAWSVIDFQGLTTFPRLLRLSASSWAPMSYSLKGAGLAAGLSATTSQTLGFLLAALLGGWAVWAAVRGYELASFAAAAAAGIYMSPVVHLHYAMWLLVLLALVRPRTSWVWLPVTALWISSTEPAASTWRLAAELCISLGLVAYVILPRPRGARDSVAWSSRKGLRALEPAG